MPSRNRSLLNCIHVHVSFPAESIMGDPLLAHCTLDFLLDMIVFYSAVKMDENEIS